MVRPRSPAGRPGGFTLIELMIVITLMAMLLLMAMPFLHAWIASNRQMQVRSQLWEGIAQVRALALRNPGAFDASEAAAVLSYSNGHLDVTVPGDTAALWQGDIDTDAELVFTGDTDFADADALAASGGPSFDCVEFNSRGVRMPGSDGCSDTTSLTRIAIGYDTQEPLYVDML